MMEAQSMDRCRFVFARAVRLAVCAAGVCGDLDVETVDLYAVGERNYDNQPDNVHYNDAGNADLAAAVAGAVRTALDKKEKR